MPEPLSDEEQLRRLREFVSQLEGVLAAATYNPVGIIPGRHHEPLRTAWMEVRPSFEDLRKALGGGVMGQLTEAGIAGARLVFELGVFNHAHDELLDHAPLVFVPPFATWMWVAPGPAPEPLIPLPVPPPYPTPTPTIGWRGRLRRLFRGCLTAGDVVLDSLAAVPNPHVAAPAAGIKEFKDGVKELARLPLFRRWRSP